MRNFMKLPAVSAATCRSPASIYRDMKTGNFPKAVRLGKQSVGWRPEDIDAWIASRPTYDVAVTITPRIRNVHPAKT